MGFGKTRGGVFTTIVGAAAVLLCASAGTAGGAWTAAVQGRSALATPSRLLAATPAGASIKFAVGLNLTNEAGAVALAREVSQPGGSQYRDFLTPAQWERRFSPSPSAVTAVSAWLRSQGITVTSVTPDRITIEAQAPAAAIERAFGTSLGEYRNGSTKVRLASRALTVPAAIASLISGVTGVNERNAAPDPLTGADARRSRSKAKSVKGSSGEPFPPPAGFANAPPCSNYYGEKPVTGQPAFGDGFPSLTWAPCGYTPAQFQGAYNLAGPIGAGIDGAGVTVAIVDAFESPTLLADAKKYSEINEHGAILEEPQFKELPASFNETGCEEAESPSEWSVEQTLDVEAVHAMAPGAGILYVGAESCHEPALFGAVEKIVDGHLAQVITDSWLDDNGELLEPKGERAAFEKVLLMATDTGIGVQFSAGDEGSNFTTLGMNVPYYPAVSPSVTAVGGTSLQVSQSDTRLGETGWSTSRSFLCSALLEEEGIPGCTRLTQNRWDPPAPGEYDYGGGGGTSYEIPAPWYQKLGEVPASLLARNAPITHEANRVEPDISMEGDPSTGMKIGETQAFSSGVRYGEYRLGGTSLSSPLLAGVMADADQAAGGALGFVNPLLYEMAAESSSPYLTAGSIYDVLAAGKQAIERNDYLEPEAELGVYTTARVLGYEGPEEFCSGSEECVGQEVELHATPGFDSMTGVGSPGPEILRFAATLAAPGPASSGTSGSGPTR